MSLIPHSQTRSFQELMLLEELRTDDYPIAVSLNSSTRIFRSLRGAYKPQIARGTFGGHVLSQSLIAASKTIPTGYICNSHNCNFVLPGDQDLPFHYVVNELSTTFNFGIREVKVYQNKAPEAIFAPKSMCFVALISFKKPTPTGSLDHQRTLDPKYLLKDPYDTLDHIDEAPDADHPLWTTAVATGKVKHERVEHALELRKLNMGSINAGKKIADRIQVL